MVTNGTCAIKASPVSLAAFFACSKAPKIACPPSIDAYGAILTLRLDRALQPQPPRRSHSLTRRIAPPAVQSWRSHDISAATPRSASPGELFAMGSALEATNIRAALWLGEHEPHPVRKRYHVPVLVRDLGPLPNIWTGRPARTQNNSRLRKSDCAPRGRCGCVSAAHVASVATNPRVPRQTVQQEICRKAPVNILLGAIVPRLAAVLEGRSRLGGSHPGHSDDPMKAAGYLASSRRPPGDEGVIPERFQPSGNRRLGSMHCSGVSPRVLISL